MFKTLPIVACCLLTLCLVPYLTPSARAEEAPPDPLARQVADAYGFAGWDEVEEIRYTFNTQRGDKHSARHWAWRPREGVVTYTADGAEPVTYRPDEVNEDSPEDLRKIDHRFINDSYWLLYPFQLMWSGPAVTDAGVEPLPIGQGEGRKHITQYPDEGGYTPGDAYDLYLDDDHRITHWVFRRGGGEKGSAITWEANRQLGPITVCTDHHNADKTFRLWFSGLSLTTVSGQTFTPEIAD